MKAIIVDLDRCNGCFNCQLACKDEHCDADWMPYAKPQPKSGQFWCRVDQEERGRVPVVRVSYKPQFCGMCDECPLLEVAPDAVYRREDGIVVIDPGKAAGRRDLVDACPLHMVFYNEELGIAQKCTGCAHLLDNGWSVPRCVDACATDALRFVDECEAVSEIDQAQTAGELQSLGSHVYYLHVPKRFIAGTFANRMENEVVIGARVVLYDEADEVVAEQETDEFGDFRFENCEAGIYRVVASIGGRKPIELDADCTEKDVVFDDVFVDRID